MARTEFERELADQPNALRRLLQEGRPTAETVARRIQLFLPRFVLLAARGSSDNAARYAQYVFGARHHLAAALAAPSLFTRYGAEASLDGALVVAISQSGQSPDIVAVVEAARAQRALTLAICNDASSALGRTAELCFAIRAGEERAVPATKSYTNELLAIAMVSVALAGGHEWDDLACIPDVVQLTRQQNVPLPAAAAVLRQAVHFAVVSRGFNYSTAFEIALKLEEMAGVMARAYSIADFLHGPVAMMDARVPLVLIAPSGRTMEEARGLLDSAHARRVPTVVISDDTALLERATMPLPLPAGTPEWLSPLPAVIPGQLWALSVALARGADPDAPPGLSKVTRTW